MDEQKTQTSAQPEHIPLLLIARELWRKLGLILMFAATVAACGYIAATLLYRPVYQTQTTFVVSVRNGSTVYANLNTASSMAETLSTFFEGDVMRKCITNDIGAASGTIKAKQIPETNLLTMTVSAPTQRDAHRITQSVLRNYNEQANKLLGDVALDVLCRPTVPVAPANSSGAVRIAKLSGLAGLLAAALYLAVRLAGVQRGDRVFCQSLTFSASANPIVYEGGEPVFLDSEPDTWNLDPETVEAAIARFGAPKALIAVHLYGMPGKLDAIRSLCDAHGILLIEDAAEALGSVYHGQKCGTFGHYGVLSFNGNKIITTSGGALVCRDEADAQHALKMATQAREPVAWYEHTELGYNYRMSNICAGIGRGQMEVLEQRVAQKRAIHDRYCDALAGLPLQLPAEPEDVRSNRWLTAALLAPDCGVTPGQIIAALAEHNIEARHIWKPMHLQPVFRDCAFVKTAERSVAEDVFARGICLPSDTKMTPEQQAQVCAVIRGLF